MQLRSQAWQHAVCVKTAQLMGLLALTSTQQKSLELSCTLGKVHDGWHVLEHLCHQMARYVHCEAGTRIAHVQHTSQDATWSSTWQALGTSCQPTDACSHPHPSPASTPPHTWLGVRGRCGCTTGQRGTHESGEAGVGNVCGGGGSMSCCCCCCCLIARPQCDIVVHAVFNRNGLQCKGDGANAPSP